MKKQRKETHFEKGYYLIGEVGKITGISKDTLHFYNKTGLPVPEHIDKKISTVTIPDLIYGSLIFLVSSVSWVSLLKRAGRYLHFTTMLKLPNYF